MICPDCGEEIKVRVVCMKIREWNYPTDPAGKPLWGEGIEGLAEERNDETIVCGCDECPFKTDSDPRMVRKDKPE